MIDFQQLSRATAQTETARLSFRAVQPADGWHLFAATRIESFNRYLMWSRPADAYQSVARMEAIADAHHQGQMSALSVMERDTGKWVGLFRFLRYRHDPAVVEISLWTHSDFYHASYGFEIVCAAIDCAFRATSVDLVSASAYQRNRAAQLILERCGFTPFGIVPRPHEDGYDVDLLEFRLSRTQWLATSAQRESAPRGRFAEARARRRSEVLPTGQPTEATISGK